MAMSIRACVNYFCVHHGRMITNGLGAVLSILKQSDNQSIVRAVSSQLTAKMVISLGCDCRFQGYTESSAETCLTFEFLPLFLNNVSFLSASRETLLQWS